MRLNYNKSQIYDFRGSFTCHEMNSVSSFTIALTSCDQHTRIIVLFIWIQITSITSKLIYKSRRMLRINRILR